MNHWLLIGVLSVIIISIVILFREYAKKQSSQINKWYRLATTDDLTHLKNHTAYTLHIKEIEKKRQTISIAFLLFDIDHFKEINDHHGHMTGDRMLQMVSFILKDLFSEPQYSVYRIGGDEFAVIGENCSEKEVISKLLQLREYENEQRIPRFSKGYSIIHQKESFDEAFLKADEMLYADKMSKKMSNKTQ
ncbi:MAG: GGDEF domain-containing protein [Ruminococcaceae bacterium]|nr:GGDEF domain-containing protein [Oscillospiraceae bacterium]